MLPLKEKKELLGASSSLLILGLLANSPSYGYEIVRAVNDAADGLFEWQEGTVYPILHRLEKEGMVRAKWQESERGQSRKYYYITAGGRGALKAETKQWHAFHGLVLRVLGAKQMR